MNNRKKTDLREVSQAPSQDDSDLEAALLADVAFLEAARLKALQDYPGTIHTGLAGHDADFSEIRREVADAAPGAQKPCPVDPSLPFSARPGRRPEPAAPASALLSQLRQAVAEQKQVESASSRDEERARQAIGVALRGVFDYLHELVAQLNHLQPPIPRQYVLLVTGTVFKDLAWQEGFAGHRSQPQTNGDLLERVSLTYRLGGRGVQMLDRTGAGSIERLRHALFDFGFKSECQERRNLRHELEYAVFSVAEEVNVQVLWRADFPRRLIVLEMRNLERLGSVEYAFPATLLTPELLDEFGRLLLGQANRFREMVLR